jgi:hypothetical protein
MSSPGPAEPIVLEPGAVTELAAELRSLAAELSGDAETCRSAAGSFSAALDGGEGWRASAVATAWAGLEEVLARQADALAGTLTAAVQAYLDEDAGLAAELAAGGPDVVAGPR